VPGGKSEIFPGVEYQAPGVGEALESGTGTNSEKIG
jgi:hypothetical protein